MEIAPGWAVDSSQNHKQLAEVWALRLAADSQFWESGGEFKALHCVGCHLGLDCGLAIGPAVNAQQVVERARIRLATLEALPLPRDGRLCRNVRLLGSHLGLTELEEDLLLFSVLARIDRLLRTMTEGAGPCDAARFADVWAIAVGRDPHEICSVLAGSGKLLSSGLVFYQRAIEHPIRKLGLRVGLCEALLGASDSVDELLRRFAKPVAAPTLTMEDYAHVAAKAELLTSYLRHVITAPRAGRNILLYGPPGTGKTELARLAAQIANAALYEGDVEGDEGMPLGVIERLQSLVLVQRLVEGIQRGAVLIDEVEDVFKPAQGPEPENRGVSAGDSKGWTVRLLESNLAPTIWISNRVEHIDHAILRRFDLALELSAPPLRVRERILASALGRDFKGSEKIAQILQYAAPAPALLTRAAEVAIGAATRESHIVPHLETVLAGYLEAMGGEPDRDTFVEGMPFDISFLNASLNISSLVENFRNGTASRVLVHGASGTGKTALAYHLARSLERPILHARGRDLVGLRAGETQIRIAGLFKRAAADESLLLLDHLDWIFAACPDGRTSDALRTHEQLCAELDRFDGTVVCTTTVSGGFDQAVLRRLPIRVRLDYADAIRLWQLFKYVLRQAGHRLQEKFSESAIPPRLRALNALTPGDFAGAIETLRERTLIDAPEALLAMLEDGNAMKLGQAHGGIGFVRT
jgi:SpoVK/Ycf46/Vps4 family AAA+-type ATPase